TRARRSSSSSRARPTRGPRATIRARRRAGSSTRPAIAPGTAANSSDDYPGAMTAPVEQDQELELEIDSLAFGGNGVARLNGFVVFVRRGLPGDRVRARVTKVRRNHAEALATEVLAPGPYRI